MMMLIWGIGMLGLATLIWVANRNPLILYKEVGVNIILLLFSCSAFHALAGLIVLFDMIEATSQSPITGLFAKQLASLNLISYFFWAFVYAGFGGWFILLRLKKNTASS
jgi:hypothetical protein